LKSRNPPVLLTLVSVYNVWSSLLSGQCHCHNFYLPHALHLPQNLTTPIFLHTIVSFIKFVLRFYHIETVLLRAFQLNIYDTAKYTI